MINEHTSAQANTPTSTNLQYGYPTSKIFSRRWRKKRGMSMILDRFDVMNMSPMPNPTDLYSYYPTSLYQPFGSFDEHNQWGSPDASTGPLQFHPQMYPPSGLEISRNLFDYPQHAYSPYHPAFTPSTFPGTPSTGDMSWNPHNLSLQQSQMPLIGSKKSSAYDEYPSNNVGVSDLLSQQMRSVNLGSNDPTNLNVLSSKDQQQYQSNNSHLSSTRPSGPKSYASVVSSDTINLTSNKSTPSISNATIRSTSNFPNETVNNQQSRHSRYQQQSSSANGSLLNWTNKNSERSSNMKPSRTTNDNQTNPDQQYNPKDFNLNPKGARFFVIKSVRKFSISNH